MQPVQFMPQTCASLTNAVINSPPSCRYAIRLRLASEPVRIRSIRASMAADTARNTPTFYRPLDGMGCPRRKGLCNPSNLSLIARADHIARKRAPHLVHDVCYVGRPGEHTVAPSASPPARLHRPAIYVNPRAWRRSSAAPRCCGFASFMRRFRDSPPQYRLVLQSQPTRRTLSRLRISTASATARMP